VERFSYKAISATGEVLEGELAAESREEALSQLRGEGVMPLRAEALARGRREGSKLNLLPKEPKSGKRMVLLFTRELAVLLRAGIPLDRALAKLADPSRPGTFKTVAQRLLDDVKKGSPLSDAMEGQSGLFPSFYVGMIRAGEAGGTLEGVLERLLEALEKAERLRQRLRSALVYPMLVLLMTAVSLIILMTQVVPEFSPLFEDLGDELPLTTRAVILASDLTIEWGWLAAVIVVVLALLARASWRTQGGRLRQDRWILSFPLIGDIVRKSETARFCRALGTLLENGVSHLLAVEIASGTLANRAIADRTRIMRFALEKGEGFAAPLRMGNVFPTLALQLIEVGEESGSLDRMLLQIADIYDEETQRAVERLLAMLVPLVTIALGILIAVVIGAVLSAILSTYDLPL
jgi:general secretion pathway protein F